MFVYLEQIDELLDNRGVPKPLVLAPIMFPGITARLVMLNL